MSEQKYDYYMIRTDYDLLKKNVVGIGWNDVNFSKFPNAETIADKIRTKYYNGKSSSAISKKLNQIKRFKNMKEGDIALIPTGSYIAFAKILNEESFSKGDEFANQRKVDVLKNIHGGVKLVSRKEFTTSLQNKFRMLGSIVLDINQFKDEIDYVMNKSGIDIEHSIFTKEQNEKSSLRKGLREKIENGKTFLEAGGLGLENLLVELFKIEGYEATRLDKKRFLGKADADIDAKKEDAFSATKFLIQAKHHQGTSEKEGIEQLIGALEDPEYDGYQGIFMTTATEIDSDAEKLANDEGIQVFKLEDIVDLIIENIDTLSPETKYILGMTRYPSIK